ncbi:serine/threonine-protein kinase [Actinophytocola sp.]|uniref:serine/threonine-protein kinase n=1 Tax=Actinophytocola sp. TaxID=1872138 RepID=UPI002D7F1EFC|nr:serine/threonine-protein kinase [Actinophytocola sp.]HET9143116.1 serine/threonine-protein kinase [Actinophytocola sp.]
MAWQFGRYRMEELLGRGGMGEVYRAYDTRHDRVVAVKLLAEHLAANDEYRRRFMREARAAARLREPHVIPIHDFDEIDGRLYLDMRLVEGDDLGAILAARGPLDPAAAVDVISQVAGALDAAHAEGLVHRDVKPSNVLLDAHGFAYLVDFGIARSVTGNADITATGTPIGSLAHMAPERFTSGPQDHRVDVYSLACLLFQCLTGSTPFPDRDTLALIHAHGHLDPPKPTAIRPGLPPDFDRVIATGMAKRPEDRFPSAAALSAAARHALAQPPPGPTPTRPIPDPRPTPPARSGRWWLAGTVALAVVALAAAVALFLLPDSTAGRSPGPASTPVTTPTTATPTAATTAPAADLSVSVPLSRPACEGYIVVVGSAVDPERYQREVQASLDAHPGANYLHVPSTGCPALRGRDQYGHDVYAVYYGPFAGKDGACRRSAAAGGGAYVRRLDNAVVQDIDCG